MIIMDFVGNKIEVNTGDSLILVASAQNAYELDAVVDSIVKGGESLAEDKMLLYGTSNKEYSLDRLILKSDSKYLVVPVQRKDNSTFVLPDFLLLKDFGEPITDFMLEDSSNDNSSMSLRDMDIKILSNITCPQKLGLRCAPNCIHNCNRCWAYAKSENLDYVVRDLDVLEKYRKQAEGREKRKSI